MEREEGAVAVRLAFVGIAWGGAYVAGRLVAEAMAPAIAIAVRLILASICLAAILATLPPRDRVVSRADLPGVFLLGLVGVLGFNLLFFLGLSSTGAVNGTLIGAAAPAATALLAALVLGERLRGVQWAGIGLSLAGVVVVVSNGSLASLLALGLNPGDLLIAAAVGCWAVYTVAGDGVVRRYPSVTVTAHTFFMATAIAVPLAAGAVAIPGPVHLPDSWTVWAALLFLGTIVSVLGFLWWNRGMAVLGPSRTAIFYNLVPVSGIVFGALFGEVVTAVHIAGAALVVGGVLLTVRGGG